MNIDQIKGEKSNEDNQESKAKKAKLNEKNDQNDLLNHVFGDDSRFVFESTDELIKIDDVLKLTDDLSKQYSKLVKKKLEPNYFLCIKVNNKKTIQACEDIQKEILKKNPDLQKATVKLETLHITLLACYLENRNEIDMLNKKLIENKDIIFENVSKNFEITFKGLSNFRNQVVYVDFLKDDHFNKLIQLQKELVKVAKFLNVPLFEKNFSPHMTLMKLSKARSLLKKGIRQIDKELYQHLNDTEFGIEYVERIHLCNIREKNPDSGFYRIEWDYEFNEQEGI